MVKRKASITRGGAVDLDSAIATKAPSAAPGPLALDGLSLGPLRPPLPPGTVAIAARRSPRDADRDMGEPVALVADVLARGGYTPVLEERTAVDLGHSLWDTCPAEAIGQRCRLVIAIGGDGTFISFARSVAAYDVPIIGVNQGRLGFLTDLTLDNVETLLPAILSGEYREERRSLLLARRENESESFLAVNDVVVSRGSAASLMELQVTLNERFAFGMRADGMIVATSTGSTAYSLSAGGPILAPGVNAVALAPIAPHALTNRPIVLSDDMTIRIRVARAREAMASLDGHVHLELAEGDAIVISKAPCTVRIWHPLSYDYFQTLREKLAWTETPESMVR